MKTTTYTKWQVVSISIFCLVLYFVGYYAQKADITTWYYGPNMVVLMGILSAALIAMVFTKWILEKRRNNHER